MNLFHQKASKQSGSEILTGQLEPSCYARSMAEADGNPTLAMSIYAKKRTAHLFQQYTQAHQKDHNRFKAMPIKERVIFYQKPSNKILSSLLCLVLFIGILSAITALISASTGEVSIHSLSQGTLVAAFGSACCISFGAWMLHLNPHYRFAKIMIIFSTFSATASFVSGVYLAKNRSHIEWVASTNLDSSILQKTGLIYR